MTAIANLIGTTIVTDDLTVATTTETAAMIAVMTTTKIAETIYMMMVSATRSTPLLHHIMAVIPMEHSKPPNVRLTSSLVVADLPRSNR
jgi:ABC-type amino acid transport system permease subunit